MKNLAKILWLFFVYIFVFISIYGCHVLNPFYTAWYTELSNLTIDNDMLFAHAQLVAFLNSGTLLYADNVSYPFDINIMFIDIVPLFAIPTKFLLLYILNIPQGEFLNIQYFGIWGLVCFIFQGIFSFLIIRKFTNYGNAVLCSLFFLFAPAFLYRFPYNQSFTGQWLILAAIIPVFYYDNLSKIKICSIYFILGVLCASVNPYFIPIVSIIVIGYCFYVFFKSRNLMCISPFVSYFIGSFLFIALVAGSSISEMHCFAPGYYSFNANVLAFFTPQCGVFKSGIFPFLNHKLMLIDGQHEGYAYLGAGIISLFIFIVIFCLIKFKSMKRIFIVYKYEFLFLLFIFLFSFIFSILPIISLSDKVICTIHLPLAIERFFSIFRTPGRFIWPAFYVVYIVSFLLLLKIFDNKKKLVSIIIFILFVIQILDLLQPLSIFHNNYAHKILHKQIKNENLWNEVLSDKKHVISNVKDSGIPFFLVVPCLEKRIKTNFIQDNRFPNNFGETLDDIYLNPKDEDLYIFVNFNDLNKQKQYLKENTKIKYFYLIDKETIVGSKNKIKKLQKYMLSI